MLQQCNCKTLLLVLLKPNTHRRRGDADATPLDSCDRCTNTSASAVCTGHNHDLQQYPWAVSGTGYGYPVSI